MALLQIKKLIIGVLLVFCLRDFVSLVWGQSCPPCTSLEDCQQRIACLTGQKQNLSAQIELITAKIFVTQGKIDATQAKIKQLNTDIASISGKINILEDSLDRISHIFANRVVKAYTTSRVDPLMYLFTADDFSQFWQRLEYLRIIQERDKKMMMDIAASRRNYHDQKELLESKRKQVETLSLQLKNLRADLDKQNKDKKALLSATQAELDKAIAQLAAFQNFVESRGGASLLSNQTKCDDWGCYYNQRDRQWGAMALNRTGYTLADSGCLVSSVAMVATHYGKRHITPVSINSNPDNFAVYFPAYLRYTVSASGVIIRREWISRAQMDEELLAGRPVIVGIGNGPEHFVVLVSGSKGNYKMHDPFIENGKDIPFSSYYSVNNITEINSVRVE